MKILGANVVNKPLDQRLESLDEDVSKIYSSSLPYSSSMMILAEEPQIMSSSSVPVFIDEMPEDQEQMMIGSPSKKGSKRSKRSKRSKS
jgi:hypothetical protein